ncbi:MAG: hypothetical protein KDG55_05830 [Rhodocyclaceae bacterium]|nr:hypothetical protein [Rhodocyclaceae bacterium]
MALTRLQVQLCITAVGEDVNARSRIDSIFSAMGRHAGFTRNALMATSNALETLGRGVNRGIQAITTGGSSEINRWQMRRAGQRPFDEGPLLFDPNVEGSPGSELQCTAIAEAAKDAIDRKCKRTPGCIPGLASTSCFSRSQGFAHMGLVLTMTDGGKYVLDWWATLDVDNPLVYRFDDFDNNRKDAAQEFKRFGGFS